MKMFSGVIKNIITKKMLVPIAGATIVAAGAAVGVGAYISGNEDNLLEDRLVFLSSKWPQVFETEEYNEPKFVDSPSRTNNAFNVTDFGEQGNNGWFYRYGSAEKPSMSKRLESFDGEKYSQLGVSGLEVKNNFLHTSEDDAPILEWRAAKNGNVNIDLTYVKSVNNDKNPSWPDGVMVYAYKGDELLGRYDVKASTKTEEVLEKQFKDIKVKELESLYFVVDAKNNNAYDGGSLYVAINDVNHRGLEISKDEQRTDNNANSIEDFGKPGNNGWTYLHGKNVNKSSLVSTFDGKEYMNVTSPNLTMSEGFIHPAINDNAILCWQPAIDGDIEVRMKYSKFEQNDGNPDYPDGVTVSVYKNEEKLYNKKVAVPSKGTNVIKFRSEDLKVTTADKLYFMVDADGNSSYDGGAFDITILDRNGATTEQDVAIDETETRQNFADIKYDFGEQGNNGWFFQEGYEDDPDSTFNMLNYEKDDDRYFDKSYLEIKRDFLNTGKGKSAVLKWQVAQDGKIKIDAAYTKLKNEDKNPSWPDGTRVTIYHNNQELISEDFEPDRLNEITKRLDVSEVDVLKDDYITMVVNPKENNAYDAGKVEFSIKGISPLVGKTEKDVVSTSGSTRTNNATTADDFGQQGLNGLVYQSGYYLDPMYAVNLETYVKDDKYTSKDGVEIKRDYIMPGNKGRSANVKWVANEEGCVDILAAYTKLKNEDKNPSWPDGVTVYLKKNNTVLRQYDFAPEVGREVTRDLTYEGVYVKTGDCITLMVDGKDNTAYDGGQYTFVVEDSDLKTVDMVNNSGSNYANLKMDFGEQGSNGWYYLEGRSINKAEILTAKTDDDSGYKSRKQKWLEVKSDYVQPRLNAHAMYKWVVARDGQIDITGKYAKFGNEDSNINFPDGVTINVYQNSSNIYSDICTCPRGSNNKTDKDFNFSKLDVKAGDILTFDVGCNKNSAWDGGRLEVDISDSNPLKVEIGDEARTNNTCLGSLETPLQQGKGGWWFLEGKDLSSARCLVKMNDDQTAFLSTRNEGLEMKRDYVHPSKDSAAIYQWVAYEDGKIDILGDYLKYGQTDANPAWPDGVKVLVYVNDTLLLGEDVAVFQGDGNNNSMDFMFEGVEVNRGDKISFVVDAKDNNAYDAGKLSVNIYDVSDEIEGEIRENNTILANDFGKQGENGWYYGMCDWDGKNFEELPYDEENARYYNAGKPELKVDYVEPGNGKNAAYRWLAAKTGKILVDGSYTKFANNADPEANGVCMRIFINGEEKKWIGGEIQGNFDEDRTVYFQEEYTVHKGDAVTFAIDLDGNDSYDGGRLEVKISDLDENANENELNGQTESSEESSEQTESENADSKEVEELQVEDEETGKNSAESTDSSTDNSTNTEEKYSNENTNTESEKRMM